MAKQDKTKVPHSRLSLLIIILEILGAAVTGIIINGDQAWYSALVIPFFAAPTWFSSVVWLFLYLFMAAALYFVYINKGDRRMGATYVAFAIAVILPVLRTFVFWQLHYLIISTTFGAVLWLLTITLALRFWHISRRASLLMVPVIIWTMFSLLVAISIFILNGAPLTVI